MGKRTGKFKGKTGKVDFIEDYLGTEELAGTYEQREKVGKMIEREREWVEAYNKKKMEQLQKRKEELDRLELAVQQQAEAEQIWHKCDWVLKCCMEPRAYEFYDGLKETEPYVYRYMFKFLFQPQDIAQIDKYIEALQKKGVRPKEIIKYDIVPKLDFSLEKVLN